MCVLLVAVSMSIDKSIKMVSGRKTYLWHPAYVTDAAAFHQLLSSASVYRSLKRGEIAYNENAMSHNNEAIAIVQSRISDANSLISDGNISAIASLCEFNVCSSSFCP
jgi:hypothetical protein